MKTQHLKTSLLVVCVPLFIWSCKKDQQNSQEQQPQSNVNQARVREQLDSTITFWNGQAVVDIKLTGYRFINETINPELLRSTKEQLLNEDNLIPYFDGTDASSFTLRTISERNQELTTARQAGDEKAVDLRVKLGSALDTLVRLGQGLVELTWSSKGKQFTTTAVYNAQGLVYDNVLANMFLLKEDNSDSKDSNARTAYTSTVRNVTIKWLWGSTRGKVVIKHTILVENGKIVAHSGSTDAWMNVGSAAAKWARYKRTNTYSQISWGYGWATPTADFEIKASKDPVEFTVSLSGVGSKGRGSGIHLYYLN
ncbi:hypothetical protein SAMN05428988_3785 [Chitinophaga sp. YR573]|uniref:hypothetical protein n=1 Tax=Chitinophaga sp. YR573 TaxID=1881040 RepID=UPI0008BE79EF|nr:hypothetical protein [Chitinophaga sp. YR573]SEW26672.1 hypothetical protein SAMN05428988_3785 [Chitinophaga sp. YR573]